MSPNADVAWGFDLGGPETSWLCDEEKYEDLWIRLDEILGWTEEPPWRDGRAYTDEDREDYLRRHDIAVPLDTDSYGHIDYAGNLLILKRHSHAYWGVEDFDSACLPPPTPYELECFNKVLDAIDYDEKADRTPKLLLWASYG